MDVFDRLDDKLKTFIGRQHMFFVATAPKEGGHINLSPKGMDTFRVLSDTMVAYLDYTGSGNETAAHLLENGRITIMFCSFNRDTNIVRLYGQGRSVKPGGGEFAALRGLFPAEHRGVRQIFVVEVDRVQTSCGYGVPLYELQGERQTLKKFVAGLSDDEIVDYQRKKNVKSIDGLPTGLSSD